ncbi:MAG: hypothetical protein EOP52_08040 [Sphingobacteriales bacterium]|nr:MAG: hypothetical protein EOP52_08040 [Sphingobacteriales bacterium]
MKKVLLGAVALTMAFTACKKDDSPTTNDNTLKFSGTTYTYGGIGTTFLVNNSTVSVTGMNGSNAIGAFLSFPGNTAPAAGKYRVVSDDSTLSAGQMSFLVSGSTTAGTGYQSTGAGNVDATVSVNGGKYTIVVPDAEAKPISGSAASTTFAANVTQQ